MQLCKPWKMAMSSTALYCQSWFLISKSILFIQGWLTKSPRNQFTGETPNSWTIEIPSQIGSSMNWSVISIHTTLVSYKCMCVSKLFQLVINNFLVYILLESFEKNQQEAETYHIWSCYNMGRIRVRKNAWCGQAKENFKLKIARCSSFGCCETERR